MGVRIPPVPPDSGSPARVNRADPSSRADCAAPPCGQWGPGASESRRPIFARFAHCAAPPCGQWGPGAVNRGPALRTARLRLAGVSESRRPIFARFAHCAAPPCGQWGPGATDRTSEVRRWPGWPSAAAAARGDVCRNLYCPCGRVVEDARLSIWREGFNSPQGPALEAQ